jgi:hypothetical protein
MEMCYSNARLPLYGKGDTSVFVAKRRHTPSNVCLPFIIKADVS